MWEVIEYLCHHAGWLNSFIASFPVLNVGLLAVAGVGNHLVLPAHLGYTFFFVSH
jgi:hypothetical protein